MSFDYFYGQQSDLFTFYRVPKVLFTNERFWNISADAKMLYGILLDRMSLSAKNGWIDKNGRVYIIFTIEEAKMALNCAEQKAIKLLSEKLILTAIREVSAYVREDEKEFIRIVRDAASAGQEQTAREQKKRLRQVEKRIGELDELIRKLYEGNATGKIPDKHFNRLLAEYDTEQNALEQEAAELKEGITAQAEDGMRA